MVRAVVRMMDWGVLSASTQLVAISAEQIQTLHLSKGSGKQNKSL